MFFGGDRFRSPAWRLLSAAGAWARLVTKILHGRPKGFSGKGGGLGVCWDSVESLGPGPGQTRVLCNGYVPTIALKGLTVFGQGSLPEVQGSKIHQEVVGENDKVESVPTHGCGGRGLARGHQRQHPGFQSAPRGEGFRFRSGHREEV